MDLQYPQHFLIDFTAHLTSDVLFLFFHTLRHRFDIDRARFAVWESALFLNFNLGLHLSLISDGGGLLWKSWNALVPILLKVGIIEAAWVLKDHIIGLDDLLQLLILVSISGLSLTCCRVNGCARSSCSHYRLVRLWILFIALKVIRVIIVIILISFNVVCASACQLSFLIRIDSSDCLVISVNSIIRIAIGFWNRT